MHWAQDARAEELSRKAKTVNNEADIAQARKEELWAKAKGAGEGADETSDRGYVKATEAVGVPPPLPLPCCTQPLSHGLLNQYAASVGDFRVPPCPSGFHQQNEVSKHVCTAAAFELGGVPRCATDGDVELAKSLTKQGEKTEEWSKKTPTTTTTVPATAPCCAADSEPHTHTPPSPSWRISLSDLCLCVLVHGLRCGAACACICQCVVVAAEPSCTDC